MPSGRKPRPARTAFALCTAAVTAAVTSAVVTPTPSAAVPTPSLEEVKQRVALLDQQAEVATEAYNGTQEKLRDLERRLLQFQAALQRQQAKVAALQGTLGVVAAAQYRSGGVDPTLQMMLSGDPERFLEQAATIRQFSEQQQAAIRQVQVERLKLAEERLRISQQMREVEQTRAELARHQAEIESKLQEAQRLLNSLTEQERRRLAAAERASRAAQREAIAREARARARAAKQSTRPPKRRPGGPPAASPPASGRAGAAVAYAKAHVGDAYRWGGAGPHSFDCSGLTMMAWRQAGVSLSHQSGQQYNQSRHVSRAALRPGDLVFFYPGISHVGLYIGGGRMVHAANPREDVKIDYIFGGYWARVYVGAARPA